MSTSNFGAGHAHSEAGSPAAEAGMTISAVCGAGRRLRSADEVEAVAADEALGAMMDIMQPFVAHLSRTWTIRDPVKLERINKTWEFMLADHRMLTTAARLEDETNDWYFPLELLRDPSEANVQRSWIRWDSFIWTGLHHPADEFQRLPPLPSFPLHSPLHFRREILDGPDLYCGYPPVSCLIASSGGLLLFTDKIHTSLERKRWRPLMVFNPLTEAWRVLPAVNCQDVGMDWWSYHKVYGHLVVDEKENTYEVILVGHSFVCKYESTSNSWRSQVFPQPLSIGPQIRPGINFNRAWVAQEGLRDVPSVVVGGKIYYGELEIDGDSLPIDRTDTEIRSHGHVRVVEVDDEAGTCKEDGRYALRTYFPDPAGFVEGSFRIKIVGCMGGMYTIIPAELDITEALDNRTSYAAGGYLPLQFYVLQFRGSGLPCGRVLTQKSEPSFTWIDFANSHRVDMFNCSLSQFYQCHFCGGGGRNWYRCIGRGRTIWVMWSDCLVRYDVVTGKSKTRILPMGCFIRACEDEVPAFDSMPSFHMVP